MTKLAYDISRCADGLVCPLSRNCARWLAWVAGTEDPHARVPLSRFFDPDHPNECKYQIKTGGKDD